MLRWASSCVRGMMASSRGAEEKPKPKPTILKRPPLHHLVPVLNIPSATLDSLWKQTNTVEAEENSHHKLKDGVNVKFAAHKTGKENTRTMIASLYIVLWPEFDWLTVGLIMQKQVKTKYTKAIVKVHPDKVSFLFI